MSKYKCTKCGEELELEFTCDCHADSPAKGGTMTTQHTPGPWEAKNCTVHDMTGIKVADCRNYGLPIKEPANNARLIAAAPEMLAELEAWCAGCDGRTVDDCPDCPTSAAIRKAKRA